MSMTLLHARVKALAQERRLNPTPENHKAWLKARMRLLRRAAETGTDAYTGFTLSLREVQHFRALEAKLHEATVAHVMKDGPKLNWQCAHDDLRLFCLHVVRRLINAQSQETGE